MQLLAYGFLALAILGTLAGIGYKVRQGGYDACKVEWTQANEAQRQREAEASAKAAADLAAATEKRRVITKTRTIYVDRNIEKLVDSGTCFKPAGVLCINGAINGDKDAAGCDTDRAVPAARPPG